MQIYIPGILFDIKSLEMKANFSGKGKIQYEIWLKNNSVGITGNQSVELQRKKDEPIYLRNKQSV
ncbi:MAG: hypothetical protein Kow0037_11210 [Calditrichia bacterium]